MSKGVVTGTTPRGQGFGGAPSGFPASWSISRRMDRCPKRPYDAPMSYPDRLLTEGEHVVTQFRPHWRLMVIPIVWMILAAVAIVLVWQWIAPDNATADMITTAVLVAALVPLALAPFLRWWFTAYVLTNERLITRTGMIARSGIEIPLDNITNVVFSQNVLERILKSGDLLIESAGESGQSSFADIPDPEGFQSLYGHASRILAAMGDTVAAGQVIALSGTTGRSTGPHLHFEIRRGGRAVDPRTLVKEAQ